MPKFDADRRSSHIDSNDLVSVAENQSQKHDEPFLFNVKFDPLDFILRRQRATFERFSTSFRIASDQFDRDELSHSAAFYLEQFDHRFRSLFVFNFHRTVNFVDRKGKSRGDSLHRQTTKIQRFYRQHSNATGLDDRHRAFREDDSKHHVDLRRNLSAHRFFNETFLYK